jgi:hypothetical protein
MGPFCKGECVFFFEKRLEKQIFKAYLEMMREGTTLRVDAKASVAAFGHIGK